MKKTININKIWLGVMSLIALIFGTAFWAFEPNSGVKIADASGAISGSDVFAIIITVDGVVTFTSKSDYIFDVSASIQGEFTDGIKTKNLPLSYGGEFHSGKSISLDLRACGLIFGNVYNVSISGEYWDEITNDFVVLSQFFTCSDLSKIPVIALNENNVFIITIRTGFIVTFTSKSDYIFDVSASVQGEFIDGMKTKNLPLYLSGEFNRGKARSLDLSDYGLIPGNVYNISISGEYWDEITGDFIVLSQLFTYYEDLLPDPPEKPHYDFAGWYLDEALTTPFIGGILTEDMTLYAKWTLKKYTVSFMTNYYVPMADRVVDALSVLIPVEMEREEAIFIGWYTDAALIVPWNPSAPVTGNMTLYAKWQTRMVNVRFIVDGELYGEFSFPYGTYLSTARSYVQSLSGVAYNLYSDPALTRPVNVAKLTNDIIVYAEEAEEEEEDPKEEKSWLEENWLPIAVGGGVVLAVIGLILLIKKR